MATEVPRVGMGVEHEMCLVDEPRPVKRGDASTSEHSFDVYHAFHRDAKGLVQSLNVLVQGPTHLKLTVVGYRNQSRQITHFKNGIILQKFFQSPGHSQSHFSEVDEPPDPRFRIEELHNAQIWMPLGVKAHVS